MSCLCCLFFIHPLSVAHTGQGAGNTTCIESTNGLRLKNRQSLKTTGNLRSSHHLSSMSLNCWWKTGKPRGNWQRHEETCNLHTEGPQQAPTGAQPAGGSEPFLHNCAACLYYSPLISFTSHSVSFTLTKCPLMHQPCPCSSTQAIQCTWLSVTEGHITCMPAVLWSIIYFSLTPQQLRYRSYVSCNSSETQKAKLCCDPIRENNLELLRWE